MTVESRSPATGGTANPPRTELSQAHDELPALSAVQKLSYGAGEAGESLKNTALQTFLLFYYVQILGMPGTLCGMALSLCLLITAAVNPFVGIWSDHARSRLGPRHPFLYAAPVPLAVALYLLFSPPSGLALPGLFMWIMVFGLIGRLAMSLYYIPHLALGAELANNFHERLALASYRMLFTQVGSVLCLGGGFTLFFVATAQYPNGQLNPGAYAPFAIYCGVFTIIFVLGSALGTQRRALEMLAIRPRERSDAKPRAIVARIISAVRLKNFRQILITLLIIGLFSGTQNVIALHLNTYFWGFTPQQSQFSFYAQILGFFLGLPASRWLASALDKKRAYLLCVAASCTFACLPVCLRLIDWFPQNGDPMVLIWVSLGRGLFGFIGTSSVVIMGAMTADAADEYELAHGARVEGLMFGIQSFANVASSGAGAALAGVVLDVIHFPRPPITAAPTAEVVWRLGAAYGPLLLLLLLIGLANMLPYDLSRERHAEIVEALRRRRRSRARLAEVTG